MLQKRIDDQPSISRQMVREAQDILHRHLKGVGLKQTAQRDTILRTFLETRDHLSTDELHRLVQKKDARIGYTTVYRTLKLLAECGLASEVAFHDGIARYEHQYNRRSHHHMVCTECGSSVEFFSREVGQVGAGDRPQIQVCHNPAHLSDLRRVRRVPHQERQLVPESSLEESCATSDNRNPAARPALSTAAKRRKNKAHDVSHG
jgi:Fur family ferric uptake transcriptional regulator